ncbi:hypothetical protein ABPG72_022434 [Tetrahymena utriculariae]
MIILGYWNLRGYGQAIRLLLEYLQVDYKDKIYHENGEEWFIVDKQKLNTNFPNLPYVIDGDVVMTESKVIPIYIIKKFKRFDLIGQNIDGSFNQNEITYLQLQEILKELGDKVETQVKIPSFREEKEKILSEQFSITFEFFYPKISIFTDYINRIENIPQIKEYIQTKENKIFILDIMKDKYYY